MTVPEVDGQSFTLIGVMPEGFQFPYRAASIGLWIPWEAPADLRSHPTRRLEALVARLRFRNLAGGDQSLEAQRKVESRKLRNPNFVIFRSSDHFSNVMLTTSPSRYTLPS